ncbi:hypothetical protein [Kiloniella majae]|uniref:hypothetical protein n=1 Tax=Kiloniella majae TaxID=1938558 RepID=UPI000A2778F1|nr:hypothetical protein [Kiloniella majae]
MKLKFSTIAAGLLITGLAGCGSNHDTLRSTYYSLGYTKGDALLAANGQTIKVNVVTKQNQTTLEETISSALNQNGPKWLNAQYSPLTTTNNKSPYQMKWAFNVSEGGNAISLCRESYSKTLESTSVDKGVVLAAFCVNNRTLTSLRARIHSEPGTKNFAKTVGLIGKKLLSATNPERSDDCKNFDDCS